MKHVILRSASYRGLEYGMLRDFEDEIARLTGGDFMELPEPQLPAFVASRLAHGTRLSGLRQAVPRCPLRFEADVLWYVLMGPENYALDLFRNWDRHVGTKILYIFDTLEPQLPVLRNILKSVPWDFTITSFPQAVPMLERETQRKWFAVPQGVKLDRFLPAAAEERVIDFSAYGRRVDSIHRAVQDFCERKRQYYDYTTSASVQPGLHPLETYKQYAWHISHSWFTFSWPVELTNPARAGRLSPLTCRWFEAAAAGTPVLGRAPSDPMFESLFGPDFVIPVDAATDPATLHSVLDDLSASRKQRLQAAVDRRTKMLQNWTWEARVGSILELALNSQVCDKSLPPRESSPVAA
jgi:Glycosyl transferases group 1